MEKTSNSNKILKLEVKDLKGNKLSSIGWLKRKPKCYVKVTVDKDVKTTALSRSNAPIWNETFAFDAPGSSELKLQVYAKRTFRREDYYVGGIEERIDSLLASNDKEAVTRTLTKQDPSGSLPDCDAIIIFTISSIETSSGAGERQTALAVQEAQEGIQQMASGKPGIAGDVVDLVDAGTAHVKTLVDIWGPLLEKVQLFVEVANGVAEVHPYAKIAWSVLSAVPKIMLAQIDRDNAIRHLCEVMHDVHVLVCDAESVKRFKSQRDILAHMSQQTTECAYFIRDYAKDRSFWSRAGKGAISAGDGKITKFEKDFAELKAAFQGHAVLQTEITVLRIFESVQETAVQIDLNDMVYAKGAGLNPEKACLPNTRVALIDEIVDWVNNPDDDAPRLFWLSGGAGSGKSTVAHTVARTFYNQKRLGSCFCFDVSQTGRNSGYLFSTIARDLADMDQQWANVLGEVVKNNRALRTTPSVKLHFDSLLLEIAKGLEKIVGPVVIVIDGLDESGDQVSRGPLLSILSKRLSELPSNFRILVTSRPEKDISDSLDGKSYVVCKHMDSIDSHSTEDDISLFIESELSDQASLNEKWPDRTWRTLLVKKSEGLFQWASTACLFIKEPGEDPCEQLDLLLSPQSQGLDRLYLGILEQKFPSESSTRLERFKLCLGKILAIKEPLSATALKELCRTDGSVDVVALILPILGSLLSGVNHSEQLDSVPVRPLHTSFRDFLQDAKRSGQFHVDPSLYQKDLTLASLRIMAKHLRFNICQLETSHISNDKVPDLDSRIKQHIPSELSYSCLFWTDHLQKTQEQADILAEVRQLLYTNLLYWLEALSLIKAINTVPQALSVIQEWSGDYDEVIVTFAADVQRFVAAFGSVISQSTPHLYLSAVPFSPEESLLSKQFLPKLANTLLLKIGKAKKWPALRCILEEHTGAVTSVAFSLNEKHIVSGSWDETIRVWDVNTGSVIFEPLEGHDFTVSSVAFSSDGKYIASGSWDKTIRVWDANTGSVISGPFEGHQEIVTSVAFSPDGKHIVSGSDDNTIRIWDTYTGNTISGPFKGHENGITMVAFSQNGKHILSGSFDSIVRVWDVDTGSAISGPFQGHEDIATSVAFSPDGKFIASGSEDNTIRVWDANTGSVISESFKGHQDAISSIAFSSNGKYIVSGSFDKTVRVWDTDTGSPVSGPFEGHIGEITSVNFSPNGKLVISGSTDQTIRVWDAHADSTVSESFEGHANCVTSVAFSSDGEYIVSGSWDKTIRVWDAKTGSAVSRPFEGHDDPVTSVAFSPDGKHIVSGSEDKTLRVWDIDTGIAVSEPLKGHTDKITSVAFSPDGKHIASGSEDKTLRVWDIDTGIAVSEPLKGHTDKITSVAFSPGGKHIASGSYDNKVRVWNADSSSTVSRVLEGHTSHVTSVAFSPNGKYIVSGSWDSTIRVWDADIGTAISEPFKGHARLSNVTSVVFSPNGKYIVSGSDDNTIRVWDINTGKVVFGPFEGHENTINSLAFSSNEKHIVSGSDDKTIRVWDIDTSSVAPKPSEAHEKGVTSNPIQNYFRDDSQMISGWVLGPKQELLFWVPPWNRLGFWLSHNITVISKEQTKLDFSKFVHGDAWQQCIKDT